MTIVHRDRTIGALVGSAVGDALGAPFEFGPAREFSERFSSSSGGPHPDEMCGGGPFQWAPGEFTDDMQMAIVLAWSLIDCGMFDGADLFVRFRAWAATAKDVGNQTRAVLHEDDWRQAAARQFERTAGPLETGR
jgi:ADP-ribosyl-[dinitrogen reductase] hydrolase